MKTIAKVLKLNVLALSLLGIIAVNDEANAQGSNCQVDFQKMMAPRQALIARINGYRNKRPTADQACSTLNQLVAADGRTVKWMTENQDWCQIPEDLINQLKGSSGQAVTSRNQACGAAKSQRAQIARARAAQARAAQQGGGGGPPAVGSGVRLPQGAL